MWLDMKTEMWTDYDSNPEAKTDGLSRRKKSLMHH